MSRNPSILAVCALLCSLGSMQSAGASDANKDWVSWQVLESILTRPEITMYLHLEIETRNPAHVSDHLLQTPPKPTSFSVPIRIVEDASELGKQAFRIDSVEQADGTLVVEISYPIEGVAGWLRFTNLSDDGWSFDSISVWEH